MNNRYKIDNLIVIGSTRRKLGKTTYILKYLKESKRPVITIKIQTSMEYTHFSLREEQIPNEDTDTGKFLKGGAKQSFHLKCPASNIKESFLKLYRSLDPNKDLICESTSIIKYIKPKKFILFDTESIEDIKEETKLYRSLADDIILVHS